MRRCIQSITTTRGVSSADVRCSTENSGCSIRLPWSRTVETSWSCGSNQGLALTSTSIRWAVTLGQEQTPGAGLTCCNFIGPAISTRCGSSSPMGSSPIGTQLRGTDRPAPAWVRH
jgi:hypothetical protein